MKSSFDDESIVYNYNNNLNFILTLNRLRLLFDIAIREKCTKLITGDNCTKLAAQILSDMAQGKGAHVALECVRII